MKMNFKSIAILAFTFFLANANAQSKRTTTSKNTDSDKKVVEVKLRPLGLLFKNFGASAEFELKENISIETGLSYNWGNPFKRLFGSITEQQGISLDIKGIGFNVNGRYYVNSSDKRFDKFYAGVYSSTNSRTFKVTDTGITSGSAETNTLKYLNTALGFLGGYKIVSKSGDITFDFTGGVGRVLFNKVTVDGDDENIDQDALLGGQFDGLLMFNIGYRF